MEQFSNFADTFLSFSCGASDTTLTLNSLINFPSSYPYRIVIDAEIIKVTANPSGTNLTVVRAQEGTTGAAHTTGARVYHGLTIGSFLIAAMTDRSNTFAVGPQTFTCDTDAHSGVVAKAHSATQTGPLFVCQNSAGLNLVEWLAPNPNTGNPYAGGEACLRLWRGDGALYADVWLTALGNYVYVSRSLYVDGEIQFTGLLRCLYLEVNSGVGLPHYLHGNYIDDGGLRGALQLGTDVAWSSSTTNFFLRCTHADGTEGFRVHGTGRIDAGGYHDTPGGVRWLLKSSTTSRRLSGELVVSWATDTDATRCGRVTLGAHDYGTSAGSPREAIRCESDGSQALLSFYGVAATGQQTGGPATAGGSYGATEQAMLQTIWDALRALGLLS